MVNVERNKKIRTYKKSKKKAKTRNILYRVPIIQIIKRREPVYYETSANKDVAEALEWIT